MSFHSQLRSGGGGRNKYNEIGANLPNFADVQQLCKQPPFDLTNIQYVHGSQISRKLHQVGFLAGLSSTVIDLILHKCGLGAFIVLSNAKIDDLEALKICAEEAVKGLVEVCKIDTEVAKQHVANWLKENIESTSSKLSDKSARPKSQPEGGATLKLTKIQSEKILAMDAQVFEQNKVIVGMHALLLTQTNMLVGTTKLLQDIISSHPKLKENLDLRQKVERLEANSTTQLVEVQSVQASISKLASQAPPVKVDDMEIMFGSEIDVSVIGESPDEATTSAAHQQSRYELHAATQEAVLEQSLSLERRSKTVIDHPVHEQELLKHERNLTWEQQIRALQEGTYPKAHEPRLVICLEFFEEASSLVVQMQQLLLQRAGLGMGHCSKPVETFLRALNKTEKCEQSDLERYFGSLNLGRQVFEIVEENLNPTKSEEEVKQALLEGLSKGKGPATPFDDASNATFAHLALNMFKEKVEDYHHLANDTERLSPSRYQILATMFLKQLKEFPSDAIKRTFLSDLTKWQNDGHKADPVQDFEDKVIQLWSQLDKPTSYPSAKKVKEPSKNHSSPAEASSGGASSDTKSTGGGRTSGGGKKKSSRGNSVAPPKKKEGEGGRTKLSSTFVCMNCGATHGAGTAHPYMGCPNKKRIGDQKWCNLNPDEWAKEKERAKNDPAHPYHYKHSKSESSGGAIEVVEPKVEGASATDAKQSLVTMVKYEDLVALIQGNKAADEQAAAKELLTKQLSTLQTLGSPPN